MGNPTNITINIYMWRRIGERLGEQREAESRGRAVGIATGYGLDNREVAVRVPVGSRIFTSLYRPDRFLSHPASYPMGTEDYFPGIKRSGREADY
jgi:hypothetical protein